jgi:2-dehydropantoate 2-reductase
MERILVVGWGGIGGVLAASLLEQGRRVACIARRREIAEALRTRGPVLRDDNGERAVRGELEVFEAPPPAGEYDFAFLAVPPNQVEVAACSALPLLAPQGALVVFQNGLCEERVARIAGQERVLGAVVSWGASSPAPGVYERTSSGGFAIGRLDGKSDARLDTLALALEAVGPVEQTRNLRGARWSKLALNCAISSLGTIGGDRLGRLLVHRFARRLALEVMTEAVAVAKAEEVRLERVAGTLDLDWVALTNAERAASGSPSLVAKHALLLAVGARYRRLRSSMLAGIERGREPPVDFLNGEVVDRARVHGLCVPVNKAAVDAVKAIWRRELAPGLDALKLLREQTSRPSDVP